MGSRLKLHDELCEALGSKNVYYQPPESVELKYPCIIYKKRSADIQYADNFAYIYKQAYDVYVIDKDPDSEIPHRVANLLYCRSESSYVAENLYHDTFVIYR